ncbi:hypothetical protein HQ560_20590, partial [bacterium]|nr:hypothetical protein [bacterium]
MERSVSEERFTRKALLAVLLTAIAAAALLLRSSGAGHVISDARVLFPGTDAYYHMRRIHKTLDDYPHAPTFDAYVNYPEGAAIYWPAGFALPLATAARLAGCEAWSLEAERFCAWSIPVLGTLGVLAVCWLGVAWRGWFAGLAAAALAAVIPALVSRSLVGRVDHDVAFILTSTLAFACCITGLRMRSRLNRVALGLLGGGFLAWSLWIWPGSVLFLPVIPLACAAHALLGGGKSEMQVVVPLMLLACLASLALALAQPGILSQSHLLIATFCGLSPLLCLAVSAGVGPTLGRRGAHLILGHLALAAVSLLVLSGSADELRFLAAFATGQADTVVAQAGEARPLFSDGLVPAVRQLTWAVAALPVAALLLLWHARRRGAPFADWLVLWWLALTTGAALLQHRFAACLAVPMSLVLGAGLSWTWRAARAASREVGPILHLGAAAVFVAACLPSDAARWALGRPETELSRVLPALEWLRANAPAGDVTDFRARPAHAVAAHWHYGHWLTTLGAQANVACPFGNAPQHQLGLERVRRIFGAKTEADAATVCRELGVRFI